ncbi:putative iron-regulated membrane protein [Pontibacter aydingkolensis]|uniref:PepSY domain-containing protein n=1 Tax=Pontibacter aydingkolensis TaxID=1911536 RepID=A0ABS7CWP1_9BACT|nr:PepSY-associated TM helix domain-containing protein [Pontibacter aydingkolensis]MBW7468193.1 PepSY domain-containing protein [Pontibacter aydingkolensis]
MQPHTKQKVNKLSGTLREYRVYHRYVGLVIGIFVLISSITGMLLGWKKDVDLLQPPLIKGQTDDLSQWVSMADLASAAYAGLDSAQSITNNPIDRIEARPDKGMAKVLFSEGYWEVQLDGSTGKVLSVAQRHSDWIEQIHDGSIISDMFKLVSMNVLGLGLLLLAVTGFTLWFYPKRIRKLKRN